MMNIFDMTGRVVLVTGSTRGMGRATVQLMVEHGARVIVSGRSLGKCQAVADELNAGAGDEVAVAIAFDLADEESCYRLVDQSVARWGRLDALVANAFTSLLGRVSQVKSTDFLEVLRINVVNAAYMVDHAAPALEKSDNASVTFIGSLAGATPQAAVAAYSVSKRALLQVMLNFADELGPKGIRVNLVAPGTTNTDVMASVASNPDVLKAYLSTSLFKKMIEPEEIAGACLFLASRAGCSITAQSLLIDNGRSLPATPALPKDYDFVAKE